MKHTLTSKAAELMRKNGRHRRWRRAFSGMAAVVVFITTYMLILPAITMENQAICGMAEHTHTDACYEMQLVCTQEETPEGADVHVHGPECYEQQQVLTCTKQEGEGHTHTDACYGYVCGQEESAGHTHTDACYTEVTHRELTCTEPESAGHTHGDGCYDADGNLVCTEAESTGHTHGDSCYTETVTRELTCGQEESSGHTHTDACIGLICGQEEYEGHTHTDACYTTEDVLVCTQPTGHTHGDGCYEKVLVCDVPEHTHTEECYPAAEPEEPQEPELICTIPEHSHEDACYDADGNLICGLEEHTHTEECYAPVEIPEEEMPTTAFPQEIPEGYVEYTFDNEAGLTVTAYAPEGAFGQDVQLFAQVLPEDSEEYAQAKENLDKAENAPEYTGMAAMDIRFVDAAAEDPAQAEEIEPDAEMGQVFVKIDAQALLPEDVDESTLAVQHHVETESDKIFGVIPDFIHPETITVETVADNTEETGDITATPGETALPETLPALADEPETEEATTLEEPAAETETEETQPAAMNVEAEFAVESFSTFTITWIRYGNSYSRPVSVYIDGVEMTEEQVKSLLGTTTITAKLSTNWTNVSNIIPNQIKNGFRFNDKDYTYDHATNGDGIKIESVRLKDGSSGDWQRQRANITSDFPAGETLRLYYYSNSRPVNITDSTADTSGTINISLYDYASDYISHGNGGDYWWQERYSESGGSWKYDTSQFMFSGWSFDGDTWFKNGGNDVKWWNKWTGQNGGVTQGIVKSALENGYPALNYPAYILTQKNGIRVKSLASLFGGGGDSAVTAYENLNHLFFYDEATGYYSFDSSINFATINPDGNDDVGTVTSFTVYDQPNNGLSYGSTGTPYFLPFNQYGAGDNTSGNSTANYHFGMKITTEFLMPKDGQVNGEDMVFSFSGDDDVWVYIDGVLVLDMGGVHDSNSGYINFGTGIARVEKVNNISGTTNSNSAVEVYIGDLIQKNSAVSQSWKDANLVRKGEHWYLKDYTTHDLAFFYLERGSVDSNCAISFNFPTIPENSLTIAKELDTSDAGSEAAKEYLNNLDFSFRVLKASAADNTTNQNDLFISDNDKYLVYENGIQVGGERTVGADGIITIKAGQVAVFSGILANETEYKVQELIPENYQAQYDSVFVNEQKIEAATGNLTIDGVEYKYYTTGNRDPESDTSVSFSNKINWNNISYLEITKQTDGTIPENNSTFYFKVMLGDDTGSTEKGGEWLGSGVSYQVLNTSGGWDNDTTDSNGLIALTSGQTARLPVLSGMKYYIVETDASGKVVETQENVWEVTYDDNRAGTTPNPDQSVTTKVINKFPVLEGNLSITKMVARTDGVDPSGSGFRFEITLSDGKTPSTNVTGKFSYTVTGNQTGGEITFTDGVITSITGPAADSETITRGDGQASTTKYYVKLDHNQTITIQGLPGGTVATIKEVNYSGYAPAWKDTVDPEAEGTTDSTSDIQTNGGDTVTTVGVSANDPVEVTCTNTTGAVLPSTGGMGTTPFLALGTLLTLGAGMLLVQRRRKEGSDAV